MLRYNTLSWILRHVTRGWGVNGCCNVPGTEDLIQLCQLSVCVLTVGNASHTKWIRFSFETIAESLVTYQQLGQRCFICRPWHFETAKACSSHGKNYPFANSLYFWTQKKWILKKKFVKLENTIEVALPMGKTGDIFFSNLTAFDVMRILQFTCRITVRYGRWTSLGFQTEVESA